MTHIRQGGDLVHLHRHLDPAAPFNELLIAAARKRWDIVDALLHGNTNPVCVVDGAVLHYLLGRAPYSNYFMNIAMRRCPALGWVPVRWRYDDGDAHQQWDSFWAQTGRRWCELLDAAGFMGQELSIVCADTNEPLPLHEVFDGGSFSLIVHLPTSVPGVE